MGPRRTGNLNNDRRIPRSGNAAVHLRRGLAKAWAQAASALPAIARPNRIAPVQPDLPPSQALDQPATLSSTLSYYFISGNTFVADTGSTTYYPHIGCV
jgi:hypothetical protein